MSLASRTGAGFRGGMVQGFPAGPYKLRGKFVFYRLLMVVLPLLAAVGCIVVYAYMAGDSASLILHDERVWGAGGPELPASVEGEVTTRQFVLSSYDLKVRYRTPDGRAHEQPLEFDTFGTIPDDRESTVRLAPGSADDFALSTAVAVSGKRWASAAFFGVVGILLLGGCLVAVAYGASKQWRRVRHAARSGAPLRCQLVARERILNQGRDTGAERLIFRVTPATGGGALDVSYQLRTKGNPVITLDDGAAVLALVPPDKPQEAILLLRDFYPIELAAAERARAEQLIGSG